MQKLSKNLICFILILILCLKTNAQTDHDSYMKREHSLVKPYQGKFNYKFRRWYQLTHDELCLPIIWLTHCVANANAIKTENWTTVYWQCHFLCLIYTGAGIQIPFWDFYGSTMVSTNYVRLTADLQSKSGSLWNQVVRCLFDGINVCFLTVFDGFSLRWTDNLVDALTETKAKKFENWTVLMIHPPQTSYSCPAKIETKLEVALRFLFDRYFWRASG